MPTIPSRYASVFRAAARTLASHRGYDRGAIELARSLARQLGVPLIAGRVSRLLVDLNRSAGHAECFSAYVAKLPASERARILARYHAPHCAAVRTALDSAIERAGSVLHLGVHTFTPVRCGERRRADVAFLYDPRRMRERRFALAWREALARRDPALRIRLNYPYRGASDGLTTSLRRALPERAYLGIELEVNQRFWREATAHKERLSDALAETLAAQLG